MAKPHAIPLANLIDEPFVAHVLARPDALVYFLCNVGDADAQVLLLPEGGTPPKRQAVIVDVGRADKVPPLLKELEDQGLFDLGADSDEPIALVVATHPHLDHVRGIPELFLLYGDQIAEYWDPGYYHVLGEYHSTMLEVEKRKALVYAQPTSGYRRWISDVAITVLSPSVQLRNRYDSYGIEINDASISLRIEFPVHRYLEERQKTEEGEAIEVPRTRSMVLGADAQTTSWAFVLEDFPFLHRSETPAAKVIAAAQGDVDLLRAEVLKVSHHGSKHGVNLELVERIAPKLTLISSVAEQGQFNFPHTVAQELIREAVHPTKGLGGHPEDYTADMGVFYTADVDEADVTLGTIGLVMSDEGCSMWRFGDAPDEEIELSHSRRWAIDPW
jgi:ribonuclease BN (tRNA processing enzyme)